MLNICKKTDDTCEITVAVACYFCLVKVEERQEIACGTVYACGNASIFLYLKHFEHRTNVKL